MLCADPAATHKLWLASDADKPEASRPMFIMHAMSEREVSRARTLIDEARADGTTPDEDAKNLSDALHVAVVGFRNVAFRGKPVEYSADLHFGCILHSSELWELAGKILRGVGMTEAERGNSSQPSITAADGSAKTADAAATA